MDVVADNDGFLTGRKGERKKKLGKKDRKSGSWKIGREVGR